MGKEITLKEFFSKLSLSEKILFSLLSAGAVAEDALYLLNEFSPRSVLRSLYCSGNLGNFGKDQRVVQNALLRLASRKLIEIERAERQKSIKITTKGLESLFANFPLLRFEGWVWDGSWRVIIYDIEEEVRRLRDRLRDTLRVMGFTQIQKSVWFSPYPIEDKLEVFLRKENLWEKVMIFKTFLKEGDSQKLIKGSYPNLVVRKT